MNYIQRIHDLLVEAVEINEGLQKDIRTARALHSRSYDFNQFKKPNSKNPVSPEQASRFETKVAAAYEPLARRAEKRANRINQIRQGAAAGDSEALKRQQRAAQGIIKSQGRNQVRSDRFDPNLPSRITRGAGEKYDPLERLGKAADNDAIGMRNAAKSAAHDARRARIDAILHPGGRALKFSDPRMQRMRRYDPLYTNIRRFIRK